MRPGPQQNTQTNVAADGNELSGRALLVLLLASACLWVVIASSLGLIASIKLHGVNFLADSAFLTYGRIRAAQSSALIYGFALQGVFAIALWLISRVGRVAVAGSGLSVIAGLFWNFGVLVGVGAILLGEASGFEGIDLPRYTLPILFSAFLYFTGSASVMLWRCTLKRGSSGLITVWFAMGALIAFGWIFANAMLLLHFFPVRGVLQVCVDRWYCHNLAEVVLGFAGLGWAFYFLPKQMGRPLLNTQLGWFALWTLAVFGGCGGIDHGAPLPAWIVSVSFVGEVLSILPVLAVAALVLSITRNRANRAKHDPALKFTLCAVVCWFVASVQGLVGNIPKLSAVLNFTLFTESQRDLFYWGFWGLTVFGATHHILPRLLNASWPSKRTVRFQFWCLTGGIGINYVAKLAGGIWQGLLLSDRTIPFPQVMKSTLHPQRIGTVGDLLLLLGVAAFLIHVVMMISRRQRPHNPEPSEGRLQPTRTVATSNPLLCFCLIVALIPAWTGLVFGPVVQLGNLQPEVTVGIDNALYPTTRPGMARRGEAVYRANGCVSCHTQQIRPTGSDLARGWGIRSSVARDYIFDNPPLLGTQRIGPDLTNIGLRQTRNTLLAHLYTPQLDTPGSIMPPYRFLFETRKAGSEPASNAVRFEQGSPVPTGLEVIPTADAEALVEYLASLRVESVLFEMPIASGQPQTNSPPEAVQTNVPSL